MLKIHSLLAASLTLGLLPSCAPEASQTATTDEPALASSERALASHVGSPKRIQAGSKLIALGVTDDDYALYWDNGSIYATALFPGAPRRFVAAASQPPMTMIAGRVAMLWTAKPYFGSATASPLVVWTAEHGAWAASSASKPPTLGAIQALAAVSPNGQEVVFVTNVDATGTVGDIVRARVDGTHLTSLVAGADIQIFGACPPHVGFNRDGEAPGDLPGHGHGALDEPSGALDEPSSAHGDLASPGCDDDALTVVAACQFGATVATLSTWSGDSRTDLSTSVWGNRGWVTDRVGRHLFTLLADRTPMVFDLSTGKSLVVENLPVIRGWMTPDGTVFTLAQLTPTTRELHRTTFSPEPHTESLAPFVPGNGFAFSNHLAQGFPYYNVSTVPTLGDGSLLFANTLTDPNTGLSNALLIDTTKGSQTPLELEASPTAAFSFENATPDSRYALYYHIDIATGSDTLVAASRDGVKRNVSVGNGVLTHYGFDGSKLAYSDGTVGNGADLFVTTDLKSVDLDAATLSPTLIAPQIYNLFFADHRRRSIIYTSDANASAPGLFVARLR